MRHDHRLDSRDTICYTKNTGWEQRVSRENILRLTEDAEPARMKTKNLMLYENSIAIAVVTGVTRVP